MGGSLARLAHFLCDSILVPWNPNRPRGPDLSGMDQCVGPSLWRPARRAHSSVSDSSFFNCETCREELDPARLPYNLVFGGESSDGYIEYGHQAPVAADLMIAASVFSSCEFHLMKNYLTRLTRADRRDFLKSKIGNQGFSFSPENKIVRILLSAWSIPAQIRSCF